MAEWEALSENEQKARWHAQTKALEAENHRRAMNKIMGRSDPYAPANEAEAEAIKRVAILFEAVENAVLDPQRWFPDRPLSDAAHLGSMLKSHYPAEHGKRYGWAEGDGDAAQLETLRITWELQDEVLAQYGVEYLRDAGFLDLNQHRIEMLSAVSIGLDTRLEPTWEALWEQFVAGRVKHPVAGVL